jgi:hypothetical protein
MSEQAAAKTLRFEAHEYEVYAVLGDPTCPPLWTWDRWREVDALFAPLLQSERGAAAVRCTQLGAKGKEVRFGKLAWNEKSHQRWTHRSPVTGDESAGWRFMMVEAWAPSWTVSVREKVPPDVFFSMSNEDDFLAKTNLAFNPVVVTAMAVSQGTERLALLKEAVLQLSSVLRSPLAVWKRRTWGVPDGPFSCTDSIQDLCYHGLFKLGPRHKRPVTPRLFEEKWSPLHPPR